MMDKTRVVVIKDDKSILCKLLDMITMVFKSSIYKRTSTTLAIAVIAALMVSASVIVALTIITEGVGISHAGAKPQRVHICHNNPEQSPPCKPLRAKA